MKEHTSGKGGIPANRGEKGLKKRMTSRGGNELRKKKKEPNAENMGNISGCSGHYLVEFT